ncbi:Rrf2 family transcriptional regulator [Chitiniphilus purpureus]|uniref:Rrf2 family transcriptional regulator n=1 Tax=Chitiniphilus purpureus TaxID=2981137 RepID=A0ABY6DN97_9NEIS|nr:Rrf2 family transcriptional regulator [Chitiniphilus sp. CD1]UXY15845.1 Rrf2 family transcriptional regulator [Chitiniphilus sp. CD1]
MKLTSFTDYTLRVLMYLALCKDRLATIQQVAGAYGISESHLTKVVHHLAKRGVIESLRGKGGGIRLALPPDRINLGAVVRAAEREIPLVECFGTDPACRIVPGCRLAAVLAEALAAFYAVLDRYTLAELVARPESLQTILFHS